MSKTSAAIGAGAGFLGLLFAVIPAAFSVGLWWWFNAAGGLSQWWGWLIGAWAVYATVHALIAVVVAIFTGLTAWLDD